MIASLAGRVQHIATGRAVIEVAGVGYEVFLSTDGLARLPEKGGEVFLHIHTHVREDALVLFGFPSAEEKEVFLLLKTVSGIGPKVALAMLGGMPVTELCQAIGGGDVRRLTSLPGIGKKTAERLCVELKDKVSHLGGTVAATPGTVVATSGGAVADALSALGNLGYSEPVARQALASVKRRLGDEAFAALAVEAMIREGLKALA